MALTRESRRDINFGTSTAGNDYQGGISGNRRNIIWEVDNNRSFSQGFYNWWWRAYVPSNGSRSASSDIRFRSASLLIWEGAATLGNTAYFIESSGFVYPFNLTTGRFGTPISTGISQIGGAIAEGSYLWLVDDGRNIAEARSVSALNTVVPAQQINLGIGSWTGGVGFNGVLFFVDNAQNRIVAYTADNRERDTSNDVDLGAGNWTGAFVGGPLNNWIFVVNNSQNRAVAYRYSFSTPVRPSKGAIYIGSQKFDRVFIGDVEYQKIYIGDQLFWEKG